jgi:hypothetical protein
MGMDATFSIWVGVNHEDHDFLDKLPPEFLDNDGIAIEDFTFETFYCSDEIVGYGIGIFYHDWDHGVKSFNVLEIAEKIEKTKKILKNFFDKQGINEKIDVWYQGDLR